ncbi:hypothetical protein KAX35_02325 [candidate division WOR-3 bacterium]|nr:hypothetical protein [candidate division WOR-3 bacterium]
MARDRRISDITHRDYIVERWEKTQRNFEVLSPKVKSQLYKVTYNLKKFKKVFQKEALPEVKVNDMFKYIQTKIIVEEIAIKKSITSNFLKKILDTVKGSEFVSFTLKEIPKAKKKLLVQALCDFLNSKQKFEEVIKSTETYDTSFEKEALKTTQPYQKFWNSFNFFVPYYFQEYVEECFYLLSELASKSIVEYIKKSNYPFIKRILAERFFADDPKMLLYLITSQNPLDASLGIRLFLEYIHKLENITERYIEVFNPLRDNKERFEEIINKRRRTRIEIHKKIQGLLAAISLNKDRKTKLHLATEVIAFNLPKSRELTCFKYSTKVLVLEVGKSVASLLEEDNRLLIEIEKVLKSPYMGIEIAFLINIAEFTMSEVLQTKIYEKLLKDFEQRLLSPLDVRIPNLPGWWDVYSEQYVLSIAKAMVLLTESKMFEINEVMTRLASYLRQPYGKRGFEYGKWLVASRRVSYLMLVLIYAIRKTTELKLRKALYDILINLFFDWIEKWEWEELTLPTPNMLPLEGIVIEKISEIIKGKDIQRYLEISRSTWNIVTLNKREKKFKRTMHKTVKNYLNIDIVEIHEASYLAVLATRLLNAGFANECLRVVERYTNIFNEHDGQKEWMKLIEILACSHFGEDISSKLETIKKQTINPEIYINAWRNLCKFRREVIPDEWAVLIKKWQRCRMEYQ